MMELSSAMRLWEEWQLRVLVISSASLQVFLFFTATTRALPIRSWIRSCIWLAYNGSDTLALYCLATLFNRHRAPADSSGHSVASASILEILWAPVLLIHLGGPASISAHDMEDNELWARHVLTLLSQVSVALYVFCKSWQPGGERLLLAAAILLFTLGVIKFSMKPWALKRASINSLALSLGSMIGTRKVFKFFDEISLFCAQCTSYAVFLAGAQQEQEQEQGQGQEPEQVQVREQEFASVIKGLLHFNDISLDEYVRNAKICIETKKEGATSDPHVNAARRDREINALDILRSPYSQPEPLLLADRFLPYSHRLNALQSFLELDESQRVDGVLDAMLTRMFRLLYTKEKVYLTILGSCLWMLTVALSFAVIGLFAKASKDGYKKSDVIVAYILLCSIAAMEVYQQAFAAACTTLFQEKLSLENIVLVYVAQQNISSFVLRKRRPTKLMVLGALIGGDNLVNKYWHVGEQVSGFNIITVVLRQLEEGWKEYIHDATSFRRFNNFRGQWTLSRQCHLLQGCHGQALLRLRRSLQQVPFDESVLLWHIATNLCFHHPDSTSPPSQDSATMAMDISNYMAYLLFLRPEMMMPGTRRDLFTFACYDLDYMLRYDDEPPLDERRLAQGIVRKARRFSWLFAEGLSPLLPEACRLAEALMELGDEAGRWKLIESVWVEMLCYSASRCRGYLHAQSLGQGRELLSYVWLLLSYMGMETYADRFQRPEPPEQDEAAGDGSTDPHPPQELHPVLEEITTA